MSELLRRGFIAALAPQGAPNMDIIVTDVGGDKLCGIQVKTRSGRGGDGGWHMRPKHGAMQAEKLFYCFADFGGSAQERPKVYVMPSRIVAEAVSVSHAAWLSNAGRGGRVRQDSSVRRLLPDYDYAFRPRPNPYPRGWMEPYLEAWSLLSAMGAG